MQDHIAGKQNKDFVQGIVFLRGVRNVFLSSTDPI